MPGPVILHGATPIWQRPFRRLLVSHEARRVVRVVDDDAGDEWHWWVDDDGDIALAGPDDEAVFLRGDHHALN